MDSEITKNGSGEMSSEERKVYDRQIRLWGYDGQNKYVDNCVVLLFVRLTNFFFYITG